MCSFILMVFSCIWNLTGEMFGNWRDCCHQESASRQAIQKQGIADYEDSWSPQHCSPQALLLLLNWERWSFPQSSSWVCPWDSISRRQTLYQNESKNAYDICENLHLPGDKSKSQRWLKLNILSKILSETLTHMTLCFYRYVAHLHIFMELWGFAIGTLSHKTFWWVM